MRWRDGIAGVLVLVALLSLDCTATPLPTPPSLDESELQLIRFQAGARLIGEPGAISGDVPPGAELRVTGQLDGLIIYPPPRRWQVPIDSDGSFRVAATGALTNDIFYLEMITADEDVFLGAVQIGDGDALVSVDPGVDDDGDGSPDAVDCETSNPAIVGSRCTCGALVESCDMADEDCDGVIDEGCGLTCLDDSDCPDLCSSDGLCE